MVLLGQRGHTAARFFTKEFFDVKTFSYGRGRGDNPYSGPVSVANAAEIQVMTATSFTCTSNADCKAKCEALGSDHTWKPDPTGTTHGTCTKRRSGIDGVAMPNPPDAAVAQPLNTLADRSPEILKALNAFFQSSEAAKTYGLEGVKIISGSFVLEQRNDRDVCASCLGDGFSTQLCCSAAVPNCNDPCRDGDYIPMVMFGR